MLKLPPEQKDALAYALYDTNTWKAMQALLTTLHQDYIDRVMNYDLYSGSDRELALLKARSEGVASFVQNVKAKRDQIVRTRENVK